MEVTDDLSVKVKLTGACNGCPYSMQTLKAGVEQAIMKEVPEIKRVVSADNTASPILFTFGILYSPLVSL